ncbi:MAG TPA: hypothetical protein VFB80_20070 [Pirellulaceae bacterium]|nr:hypothetical protein [Pirellulaceae bacterium]
MDPSSKLTPQRELAPATKAADLNPYESPHSSGAPTQKIGWLGASLAAVGALVSALYLANVTGGFLEFSPDNLPGFGNLDEFLFSLLLVYCLQKLGINLLPFMKPGASRGGGS